MAKRWAINGKSDRLYFLGLKNHWMMTVAMKLKDTCSLEESMTNLDSILKSRDTTLLTRFHIVKAMIFPVVMHGYESWMIKKAEC